MIMQKYSSDFAPTEADKINWVWKYFTGNSNFSAEEVIGGINKRSIMIKYAEPEQ